jgi:hypothetical protein
MLDELTPSRHRDLVGRRWHVWIRRGLLLLVLAACLAGLANAFGQRPSETSTGTARARLDVTAPERVRGGLLYETRFTIHGLSELKDARLVLAKGWSEGLTINTIEPSPVGEASDDGRLSLDLGHVPRGGRHILYVQYQVNPTTVELGKSQDVELWDGDVHLLTQHRALTVFP